MVSKEMISNANVLLPTKEKNLHALTPATTTTSPKHPQAVKKYT
jgi:hypothetical protein